MHSSSLSASFLKKVETIQHALDKGTYDFVESQIPQLKKDAQGIEEITVLRLEANTLLCRDNYLAADPVLSNAIDRAEQELPKGHVERSRLATLRAWYYKFVRKAAHTEAEKAEALYHSERWYVKALDELEYAKTSATDNSVGSRTINLRIVHTLAALGELSILRKDPDGAMETFKKLDSILTQLSPLTAFEEKKEYGFSQYLLAWIHFEKKEWEACDKALSRVIETRKEILEPNNFLLLQAEKMRGQVFEAQGRDEDAEKQYLKTLEGYKQWSQGKDTRRVTEMASLLQTFFEKRGRHQEALELTTAHGL